jgi:O-antigen/teichoic acid export membrane protein
MLERSRGVLATGIILGLVNLSWFIFFAMAGRTLSPGEFGKLALIPTFVNLIVSISDLGLSPAAFRRLKKSEGGEGEIRGVSLLGVKTVLPLALILGVAAPWIYGMEPLLVLAVALASVSLVFARLVSMGILRAKGRTVMAAFMQRGNRFLVLLLAIPLFFLRGELSSWALIYGISCLPWLIWALFLGRVFSKDAVAPSAGLRAEMKPGLVFWMLSWIHIATIEVDRLIIAGTASFEDLGLYYAVINIMAGFQLLQTALSISLPAEMAKANRKALRRATLKALVFSALLALVYLIAGPWLLDLAYGGKFVAGEKLILPFIALGAVRSLYLGPSSKILLGAGRYVLTRLFSLTVIFALLQVVAIFVGYGWNGLEGVVWSLTLLALLRFIAVYRLADREDTHA